MTKPAYLFDLVEQMYAAPANVVGWLRLSNAWQECNDQAARAHVMQQLAAAAFNDHQAEVLRLTFLADYARQQVYLEGALAHALAIEPPNADQLVALATQGWVSALEVCADHASFIASLLSMGFPAVLRQLTQMAENAVPADFPRRQISRLERVTVVVPCLGSQLHPPSVMAENQWRLLAQLGLKIQLVSCQELQAPEPHMFRGGGSKFEFPPPDVNHWAASLPQGSLLGLNDPHYRLQARWADMFRHIAAFDPDVVLMVGLYSPLAAVLHALRPVVGLNVFAFAPLAPLDVWLAPSADAKLETICWPETALPVVHHHPFRIRGAAAAGRLSRNSFNLRRDELVWLSSGGRLAHEISEEWADMVNAILAGHPEIRWLLAGTETVPERLRAAFPGQIRAVGVTEGLGDLIRMADIYVNPPRVGGGFSVAEAMAAGLAVVSLAGGDGGDKVGEWAYTNLEQYRDGLVALCNSAAARRTMGAALQQRFRQQLDVEAGGPSLLAAMHKAIAVAAPRLAVPQ
ncbi:glycosyltransferase [Chitinimonas sp.]|uniref:glycosyltransferase n=1 Tax=Chitinimonas sp. TaxID=1934313 RepID=UPI0035ADD597